MGIEVFVVCSFLFLLVLLFSIVQNFIDGFITLAEFKEFTLDVKKINSFLKKI